MGDNEPHKPNRTRTRRRGTSQERNNNHAHQPGAPGIHTHGCGNIITQVQHIQLSGRHQRGHHTHNNERGNPRKNGHIPAGNRTRVPKPHAVEAVIVRQHNGARHGAQHRRQGRAAQ